MIKNKVKLAWAEGRPVVNGWLSVGNPFTAEIMAAAGFDSLTIDLQHGFLDYSEARMMLQAIRASGVTPIARAPWREPGVIMKLLDAGAYGIICPMVNTSEEAADLVAMVRYPPRGYRSFGPTRANFSAGGNYAAEANDEIIVLAMIETAEACENVDAICATPGLDGVYIGPSDLTLGVANGRLAPGLDRREPEMVETIGRILGAARGAGIRAAIHCGSREYAAEAVARGFDMVTIGTDVLLLSGAAKGAVAEMRALLGQEADMPDLPAGGY